MDRRPIFYRENTFTNIFKIVLLQISSRERSTSTVLLFGEKGNVFYGGQIALRTSVKIRPP